MVYNYINRQYPNFSVYFVFVYSNGIQSSFKEDIFCTFNTADVQEVYLSIPHLKSVSH